MFTFKQGVVAIVVAMHCLIPCVVKADNPGYVTLQITNPVSIQVLQGAQIVAINKNGDTSEVLEGPTMLDEKTLYFRLAPDVYDIEVANLVGYYPATINDVNCVSNEASRNVNLDPVIGDIAPLGSPDGVIDDLDLTVLKQYLNGSPAEFTAEQFERGNVVAEFGGVTPVINNEDVKQLRQIIKNRN